MGRIKVAALSASAVALVSLAVHEGYREQAYIPIPGDVPTIGYGTTEGVKLGDRTDPIKALQRALSDMQKFEGAIKECVKVPLYQHEYDALVGFSYNVGSNAFCKSTLVRKLNAGDYKGACDEILRWDRAAGKVIRGLTNRTQKQHKQCLGQ
jgi:lysozyme